jgi:hypothetical protein
MDKIQEDYYDLLSVKTISVFGQQVSESESVSHKNFLC